MFELVRTRKIVEIWILVVERKKLHKRFWNIVWLL
jgi:hypothetical protein